MIYIYASSSQTQSNVLDFAHAAITHSNMVVWDQTLKILKEENLKELKKNPKFSTSIEAEMNKVKNILK